jgi:hypothetical protein
MVLSYGTHHSPPPNTDCEVAMMRKRTTYYILFFVSALLLTTARLVGAQDMPATIEITWVDTSQYPNVEVYTDPRAADGSQQTGLFLFADRAGLLTEDGS